MLGRASPATSGEPRLRPAGDASSAGWRAEGASTEWCTLRAASVAGVRHRLAGQEPEDSFAWAHADGVLLVAVTDGVGSVAESAGAAARAGRAAVDAGLTAAADGPEAALRTAVDAANRAAHGGGATTLVVALVDRAGTGAVARVGDSTAFLVGDDGPAVELFDPPDPDRVDAATAALPAARPEPEIRRIPAGGAPLLVLVTDGVADPWRDGPTTVAPAVTAALRERPDPPELLVLADFSRQGCHDDRTLVCVWPLPEQA